MKTLSGVFSFIFLLREYRAEPIISLEIISLDENNFDSSLASGDWFVQFLAPWSQKCTDDYPLWKKFAHIQSTGKVGVVDVVANPEFIKRFNIRAYPTYILFQYGPDENYERYFGEISFSAFDTFAINAAVKKAEDMIILRYFKSRERGEIIRLTLEACGLLYEQHLHSSEEWPEIKKSGYGSGMLPFAQVPALHIDQRNLVQTMSIVRYIGSKHGLLPSNLAIEIDILLGGVEDLQTRYFKLVYNPNFVSEKDDYLTKVLPVWLGHFERYLSKSESDYLVGGVLTVADLALFDIVTANLAISESCLTDFPLLQKHVKMVSFHEPIRNYLISSRRPPYQNGASASIDNESEPSPYWNTLLKSLPRKPKHGEL